MDPVSTEADPLRFLLERHDADRDGVIPASEYGRTRAAFETLDRNRDGLIDVQDFDRQRANGAKGKRRQLSRARRVVAQFFQSDGDDSILEADELAAAFERFDGDHNGAISEEEFRCGSLTLGHSLPGDQSASVKRLMEGTDPWIVLGQSLDGDQDLRLTYAELLAFFRSQSQEGVWTFLGDSIVSMPSKDFSLRPLEGLQAPEFCLATPEGDSTYCLSELRETRPVALIFGSYT